MNSLEDVLVARGTLAADDLRDARQRAQGRGRSLVDELLATDVVAETDLYRAVAELHGLEYGSIDDILERLDRDLVNSFPRPYLEHAHMVPVERTKNTVTVATADPDSGADDIARALGVAHAKSVIVTRSNLRRIWSIIDVGSRTGHPAAVDRSEEVLGDADLESRMVGLFEAILLDAIGSRASDLHLEQYTEGVRLRYRIDGALHDIRRFSISSDDLRGVVNVIKIAADMDITERRLPQGGRMRRRAGEEVYDLRVQTQPSLHGEHVVIRLLHQDVGLLSVEELGFETVDADAYRRLLRSPQGMVLVVGPTGSGKSTTLYAGLRALASDSSRKVITVEDPIEYAIEGVQQTQVRPVIGFRFSDAMRAFVREDPDVILVGEIRDSETALEAIRASQTGHLVLSTLHCNDTVDAVQRLTDLGMHANSIASELVAVISQRLVRRICEHCKAPAEPDPEILAELFPAGFPDGFRCWAGTGCARCNQAGTRGRIATFEFLRVDEKIRRGISNKLTVDELRHIARDGGLKPIRAHLLELVLRGVAPLSEVPRTLSVEQMAPELAQAN